MKWLTFSAVVTISAGCVDREAPECISPDDCPVQSPLCVDEVCTTGKLPDPDQGVSGGSGGGFGGGFGGSGGMGGSPGGGFFDPCMSALDCAEGLVCTEGRCTQPLPGLPDAAPRPEPEDMGVASPDAAVRYDCPEITEVREDFLAQCSVEPVADMCGYMLSGLPGERVGLYNCDDVCTILGVACIAAWRVYDEDVCERALEVTCQTNHDDFEGGGGLELFATLCECTARVLP
ncbi:MAG: hypothetical protein ACE366_08395 [Bradymonadia bacterium]